MSEPSPATDADLVRQTLAGERRAFSTLVALHREAVYRFIRRYTGDGDEALDLAQETFASVYLALRSYDLARPFRTWVMRIAVNKCHDWSRRRAVRSFLSAALPIEKVHDVASNRPSPEQEAGDALELNRVSEAVARLPGPLREVLILRTIDGLSQAEAAEILAISEKAVENKLRRARQHLSELLAN